MGRYAFVHDGIVLEIIEPRLDSAGKAIPLAQRYHPAFVAQCVDITDLMPAPNVWWTYDSEAGAFSAPA